MATTTQHDYADAQRRGNPVTVLVMETTGALSTTFARPDHARLHVLRHLARVPA